MIPAITSRFRTARVRRATGAAAALVLANLLIFCLTDPYSSMAILVIGGFLVATLNLLAVLYVIIVFLGTVFPPLSVHRRRVIIALWIFLSVLLALSSVGQLSVRDVVVVLGVGGLGYFYSLYFRLNAAKKN